jgi:flagellar motility protein MotE (MotC chaperone)
MSTMLKEVYDAFKEAGASEEKASAAAIAVATYQLNRSNLATKEDIAKLKEDIAGPRTELRTTRAELVTEVEQMGRVVIMWNVGTLLAVAGLVFAIIHFAGGGGP